MTDETPTDQEPPPDREPREIASVDDSDPGPEGSVSRAEALEAKLRDGSVRGLVERGFMDQYALMEATRQRAVQRAAAQPLPSLGTLAL
ncbi:MAG: hypothetical protein JWO62_2647, partial [Acidimicrobiaceae bacterium]|nr:hypothetical protein [Acidimicrobiaceae bacterium]